MVLMKSRTRASPSATILAGVLAAGNSAGRRLVDAGVGRLRGEHDRDQQRVGIDVLEFALGLGIARPGSAEMPPSTSAGVQRQLGDVVPATLARTPAAGLIARGDLRPDATFSAVRAAFFLGVFLAMLSLYWPAWRPTTTPLRNPRSFRPC